MNVTYFTTIPDDLKEVILCMLARTVSKSKRNWGQFQVLALSDNSPLSALTHRLFNSVLFKDGGALLEFDFEGGELRLSSEAHESLVQVVLPKCQPFEDTLSIALANRSINSLVAMTHVSLCCVHVKRLELVWHDETSDTVATLFEMRLPQLEQLSISIRGIGTVEAGSKLLVFVSECAKLKILEIKGVYGYTTKHLGLVVELLKISGECLEEVDLYSFNHVDGALLHALRAHCRHVKRLSLPFIREVPGNAVVSLCTYYGTRLRKLKLNARGLSIDNIRDLVQGCANVRVALVYGVSAVSGAARLLCDRLEYLDMIISPALNESLIPSFEFSQLIELRLRPTSHMNGFGLDVTVTEILANRMPRLRILSIEQTRGGVYLLCNAIARRTNGLEVFTLSSTDVLRDGKSFECVAKSNPHLQHVTICDRYQPQHFASTELTRVYEEILHSFVSCTRLKRLSVYGNGVIPAINYATLPARIRSTEINFEMHKPSKHRNVQHED